MAKRPASLGTPATAALDRAGVAYTVHRYVHDPAAPSYGLEAADALGRSPQTVFKTLLVAHEDGLGVGIVPVDTQLDLKAMAAALGVKKCQMARPEDAERASGYVVGGISPVGQRKALPTVLDESALAHATVLVSAGARGADVELAPADLAAVAGARIAAIARRG